MTGMERDNTIDSLEWLISCVRHGHDQDAIGHLQDVAAGMGFDIRPINDATPQARLAEIYDGMNTL